jgi:amino acid transporter
MKWIDKDTNLLLQRSFLFGATGIVICLIPLFNNYFQFLNISMGPINGIGILLQFFGLSIAVMVLRKRKVEEELKDKAKKMILVLTVALIFFFMVI